MINVMIFGNNDIGKTTRDIIEKLLNYEIESSGGEPIQVVGFVDIIPDCNDKSGENFTFDQYVALYKKIQIPLILPIQNILGHKTPSHMLKGCGVDLNDVYISSRLTEALINSKEQIENFITPFYSARYLPYLEFHVADQCNLNCKACEHYSGLVTKDKFPVYEDFEKEMIMLHEFIDDIGAIRILGGEPLLNPELPKYISLSRKLFGDAMIFVVTNALLLKAQDDSLFSVMRENNACFFVSTYPPVAPHVAELEAFLDEHGVKHFFSPVVNSFTKKQILDPRNDRKQFYKCTQAKCINLYEGKLASCFLPFTTKYFNEYFDKNLPEDGAIDLFAENLTTETIKMQLEEPFERCRYCTDPKEIPWEKVSLPSTLEDWVI